MNVTQAIGEACKEPSLVEALTWICVWETERVVKQARTNPTWNTMFKYLIKEVIVNYPLMGEIFPYED